VVRIIFVWEALHHRHHYTESLYKWAAPRTIDLPLGGEPYTIKTQGEGCNGWSSDFLTTWAGMQVTEYATTPLPPPEGGVR